MNQLNTEREQRFIDLAAGLADDFAQRAAQHDEEASFPYENYARLKESGYTRLIRYPSGISTRVIACSPRGKSPMPSRATVLNAPWSNTIWPPCETVSAT